MKPKHTPMPVLTEGPVGPHLIRMALPVMIAQLIVLVYGLADSFFVSHIDSSATWLISGMGLIFPLFFIFIALGNGLSTGTASLVARALGAKDNEALEKAGDTALFLSLGGALATAALFYIIGPSLVGLIAGSSLSPQAVAAGRTFLFWLIPGFALLLVNNALAGILQGEGRMMVTFAASGLSVLLNLALDPLLIFGCGLGIAGAGLATSLSIALSTLFLLAAFLRNPANVRIHFRLSRVKASVMSEIVRVGAPQAGNMMLLSLGFVFVNYAVSSLGEDVMNAWALVGRADDIILLVAYGLSAALLTMTGQNAGAGLWKRVGSAFRLAVLYGMVASLALSLLYILLARPLFSLLSGNPVVVEHCVRQVAWISWSYVGVVASIIVNALFLGLGRPWAGVLVTFVRMELILAPGVFLLTFVLGADIQALLVFFASVNVLTMPVVWLWGKSVLNRGRRATDYRGTVPEPREVLGTED
jgi:putative MATE family efflux protein